MVLCIFWLILSSISLLQINGYPFSEDNKFYGIITNILFAISIGWLIAILFILSEVYFWFDNLFFKLKRK